MNRKNKESKVDATEEDSATANDLALVFDEFDSFYEDSLLRREFRNIVQKRHFKNYDPEDC